MGFVTAQALLQPRLRQVPLSNQGISPSFELKAMARSTLLDHWHVESYVTHENLVLLSLLTACIAYQ
jgi:hypothetical protein